VDGSVLLSQHWMTEPLARTLYLQSHSQPQPHTHTRPLWGAPGVPPPLGAPGSGSSTAAPGTVTPPHAPCAPSRCLCTGTLTWAPSVRQGQPLQPWGRRARAHWCTRAPKAYRWCTRVASQGGARAGGAHASADAVRHAGVRRTGCTGCTRGVWCRWGVWVRLWGLRLRGPPAAAGRWGGSGGQGEGQGAQKNVGDGMGLAARQGFGSSSWGRGRGRGGEGQGQGQGRVQGQVKRAPSRLTWPLASGRATWMGQTP